MNKSTTIEFNRTLVKPTSKEPSPDTLVVMNKSTGETAKIQDIQIPDLWHIAMWLQDVGGTRSEDPLVCKVDGTLDLKLKSLGQQVLDTWRIAHALQAHIIRKGE